ncbi:EAL domain-containing protein [Sporosarcina sp. NPDC096371]|uniref:EAL domain-containing protein n=1 Tax=Sporosarcina sp. NPDC096371 TaxID=3364530 RepID=UPI0038295FC6
MNLKNAYETQLETSIKIALEKDQFRLSYQPKVDVVTGKIVGVEALIRWEHPERGIIPPLDFIPIAEETGLIIPIGEWVLRTACKQNRIWQEAGLPPFVIAVNLSARQLYQTDLVQMVQDVLGETKLAPEYLELEITESMMMDVQHVLPIVKELKRMGVRLSLDDFGTGYSSLHYLKEFPIDEIKIDKSFVRVCTSDAKDATITKAIIAMAHQLKLSVVAEGVETKEQLVFLQQHLCNKAQGFLFSKPILPEEFVQNFEKIERIAKQEGIPQELSRQKWLEEALENARQELQDTVRQQQGMIFKFTERNGKFIHTLSSGELLNKIGLGPQTLIGRDLYEVLPFHEAERKSYYYRKAWEGEENVSYEGKLNGVWYLASLRPIRKAGKVVEVIASCVDITKRIESEERFQKIAAFSPMGIGIFSDGQILYTNLSALKILREDNVVGKSIYNFLPTDTSAIAEQRLAISGREPSTVEMNLKLHDGEIVEVELTTVPINYEGSPSILVLFSDETKRKKTEQTFRNSIKKLEDVNLALDESSILAITNKKGIIQFVNDKFCEISKYPREELMGKDHKILNSGYHPKGFFKEMWRTIGRGKTWKGEIRNKAKDGSFYWVHTTVVPFLNSNGKPYQYVSIRTDITERKQVEEALRLSEERYRLITDNMTDLVCIIDGNGFCKYASPSHFAVLGFPIGVYGQKDGRDLIHADDVEQMNIQFKKMVDTKKGGTVELRCKDANDNWMWLEARATPIFDKEGVFEHFLIVSREISERKMYEEKLTYMAYHDMLTDLPNRRLFLKILKKSLEEAIQYQRKMAVIYLDMDGFKQINDTFGHDVGDEVLKQFVQRVQGELSEGATFARQGGDEFMVVLPDLQAEQDAIDIAERIIISLQERWQSNGLKVKMTASLGLAFYPRDGETEHKLMEFADKALYRAKEGGRNNYKTYSIM